MHTLLMEKLAELDFDFEKDRLIAVGDLIDRGDENIECLLLLEKPWFHAVMGNHEDMMLGGQPQHVWHMNGGEWEIAVAHEKKVFLRKLIEEKMPIKMTVDTVFGRIGVVHADTDNTWTVEDAGCNLWGRQRIRKTLRGNVLGVGAVVCGHTPLKHLVVQDNVVFIDTGACFDEGHLTVLEAGQIFELVAEQDM